MPEILLIGASGLAREVLSLLRTHTDPRTVAFLDDRPELWGTSIDGVLVRGSLLDVVNYPTAQVLLCVGRGSVRAALVERLDRLGIAPGRYARVIHPSVEIPDSCQIGTGSILLAGVVLTTDVSLGDHVVVMPHVTLTHGDRVDSFATLCAGVTLGGDVQVGSGAYLGMNSAVRERVSVGANATLGTGAMLMQDLPSHETWVGVPARRMEGK